jgi:hypothetical protein
VADSLTVGGQPAALPADASRWMGENLRGDIVRAMWMMALAAKWLSPADAEDVVALYDRLLAYHHGPDWAERPEARDYLAPWKEALVNDNLNVISSTDGDNAEQPTRPATLGIAQSILTDTEYGVSVDVGGSIDWRRVAQAVHRNPAARAAWILLARSPSAWSVDLDRALMKVKAAVELSDAGRFTLPPAAAAVFGQGLMTAAMDPPDKCGREGCDNYGSTQEGDLFVCTVHASPDEYDEYERGREH